MSISIRRFGGFAVALLATGIWFYSVRAIDARGADDGATLPDTTVTDSTGPGFEGDVVLLALSTAGCERCADVEAWIAETYAVRGEQGLVVLHVNAKRTSGLEAEHVVATIRANGLSWPDAITDQLRSWRRVGVTREWPALMVFDQGGRLIFAGAGETARRGARLAIDEALGTPLRGEAPLAGAGPVYAPLAR